jgi:7-carboxy-7-deazaguanine synthase
MRGKNPIRPPEKGDGSSLAVQEIFATLQGEGLYTGHPAVFIRLGGCNLACDFCDTEFESFNIVSTSEIIQKTVELSQKNNKQRIRQLVVITGGEPFRQPIEMLVNGLIKHEFKVQIETNGTLYRALPEAVDIICSPKNVGQGYGTLRSDILAQAKALKFIISDSHPLYRDVGNVGQDDSLPVYVQPMDEYDEHKNTQNIKRATMLALENGYRLSIQTHKIAGIP